MHRLKPLNTKPKSLATNQLTRTLSTVALEGVGNLARPTKDAEGRNVHFMMLGKVEYQMVDAHDFTQKCTFVDISSSALTQDAIIYDENAPELQAHYQAFRKTIPQPTPSPEKVLELVHAYVGSKLKYSKASQHPWRNKYVRSDNDLKEGVVPFAHNLETGEGVCRHFAILTADLVKRLVRNEEKDQPPLLPPGTIHLVRDNLTVDAHAVVVYRPHNLQTIDAYLIDSTWSDVKPCLIRKNQAALRKKYIDSFIDHIIFRHLGAWCPHPDMTFEVGDLHCIYQPHEEKAHAYVVTQQFSRGAYRNWFQIQSAKKSYLLKKVSLKGVRCPSDDDQENRDYTTQVLQAALDETEVRAKFTNESAVFTSFAPIQMERKAAQPGMPSPTWVTNSPEVFVLMPEPQGVPFEEFKVASAEQYLNLLMTTVRELEKVHAENVVLLNIQSDNVLVASEHQVAFNFDLPLRPGHIVKSFNTIDNDLLPPEFRVASSHAPPVSSAQDIYGLGRIFQNLFDKNPSIFAVTVQNALQILFDGMLGTEPTKRVPLDVIQRDLAMILRAERIVASDEKHCVDNFVKSLNELAAEPDAIELLMDLLPDELLQKIFTNPVFLNHRDLDKKLQLFVLFLDKAKSAYREFPAADAVRTWCVCSRALGETDTLDETSDPQEQMRIIAGLQQCFKQVSAKQADDAKSAPPAQGNQSVDILAILTALEFLPKARRAKIAQDLFSIDILAQVREDLHFEAFLKLLAYLPANERPAKQKLFLNHQKAKLSVLHPEKQIQELAALMQGLNPALKTEAAAVIKPLLMTLLTAKSQEFERQFPSVTALDKWCYCQSMLIEMAESVEFDEMKRCAVIRDRYEFVAVTPGEWKKDTGKFALTAQVRNERQVITLFERLEANSQLPFLNYFPVTEFLHDDVMSDNPESYNTVIHHPILGVIYKMQNAVPLKEFKFASAEQFLCVAARIVYTLKKVDPQTPTFDLRSHNVLVIDENQVFITNSAGNPIPSQFFETNPDDSKRHTAENWAAYTHCVKNLGAMFHKVFQNCRDTLAKEVAAGMDELCAAMWQQAITLDELHDRLYILWHAAIIIQKSNHLDKPIDHNQNPINHFMGFLNNLINVFQDSAKVFNFIIFFLEHVPENILNNILAHPDFQKHKALDDDTKLFILFMHTSNAACKKIPDETAVIRWCIGVCTLSDLADLKKHPLQAAAQSQKYAELFQLHQTISDEKAAPDPGLVDDFLKGERHQYVILHALAKLPKEQAEKAAHGLLLADFIAYVQPQQRQAVFQTILKYVAAEERAFLATLPLQDLPAKKSSVSATPDTAPENKALPRVKQNLQPLKPHHRAAPSRAATQPASTADPTNLPPILNNQQRFLAKPRTVPNSQRPPFRVTRFTPNSGSV